MTRKPTLIADAGGTSTQWALIASGATPAATITTGGIHALTMSAEAIDLIISSELIPKLPTEPIGEIYFYGAGCLPGEPSERIAAILAAHFPGARIEVASDMLCAARALCGADPGIACILGTGSNSCLFDGRDIIDNVSPLGFILGDEGSGAVLGKLLIGNILKRIFPAELRKRFDERYSLTPAEIINSVYRRPAPNSYLASFAPFIADNIGEEPVERMVVDAFRAFLRRNVANYEGWQQLPVHFTGSIANVFRPQLLKACAAEQCRPGRIISSPAAGIIEYHITQRKHSTQ